MAYDPRTGIQSFAQADPSADVNAAIDVPEAVAPSTATALAPAPTRSSELQDWLEMVDQSLTRFGYDDPYNNTGWGPIAGSGYNPWGYVGEDLIRGPLDQLADAAGAEGVDWLPFLDQYWMDEWQDQVANRRAPAHIFSHRQGYGDILSGVSNIASQQLDLPQLGEIAAENIGPGTDFYRDYNELPNWIESRRDKARTAKAWATMAPVLTGLFAPYIVPGISEAAGGGTLGTIASGAAMGGLQGLFTGDPVGGAVRGGISAGVPMAAGAAADYVGGADGMLSRLGFSSDAQFGGTGLDDTRRVATSTSMMPAAIPETPADLAAMGLAETAPGVWARTGAAGMIPTTSPSYDPAAPNLDVKEPSLLDQAGRYVKLGQALASLGGGRGAPQDAPQREEGQSDADYAQSLAEYVNVDARALAEMGLTPGTPQYYEHLMGQLDSVLSGYEDAADLRGQLRGKTQSEITDLRRALFVRGQLEQLMGSGTYTDPFSGRDTEVIDAGGTGVNPGMAAYHRGLGNTIEGFAGLDPTARREEIGSFLDRDVDLYGAQGRMDARSEQEAMVQAFLEDLKRRQSGMLRGAFWE